MKETELTQAIKDVLEEDLPILDQFVEEEILPLAEVGNPEKLLKKKYEDWTPEDFAKALAIYGTKLDDFIAKKEVNSLLKLEAEEV
jgi:hypothetical protein